MQTESGTLVEWRIENLGLWREEVHGKCINSPRIFVDGFSLKLYPKGVSGEGEHPTVLFCSTKYPFSGEISLLGSDGSLLFAQQEYQRAKNENPLELPSGLRLDDVVSRTREDFITVRCRINCPFSCQQRMCTILDVLKLSSKLNPKLFENMNADEERVIFQIPLSLDTDSKRLMVKVQSKGKRIEFSITMSLKIEAPVAVKMCMSWSDKDQSHGSVKMEHIFHDTTPWTVPHSLAKKELVEKGIFLHLDFKIATRDLIRSSSYINYNSKHASIDFLNSHSSSAKVGPSVDSYAFNQTEESVKEITNDFLRLYQDQKFSDLELKCADVTFSVHKNILSARSPVFEAMLATDMQEASSGLVVIVDLDPSILRLLLIFLYTGAVGEELLGESAIKLYYAADKYQVPSLKKKCAGFLSTNISIPNVCDILILAHKHQDDRLISKANDFILRNYNDVLKSKEWTEFMCSDPLLAVKTLTSFAVEDRVSIQ